MTTPDVAARTPPPAPVLGAALSQLERLDLDATPPPPSATDTEREEPRRDPGEHPEAPSTTTTTTTTTSSAAVQRSTSSTDGADAAIPKPRRVRSIHDDDDAPAAESSAERAGRAVYDAVFEAWPSSHGKHISRRARDAAHLTAPSLVYGEITYASFFRTLEKIRTLYGFGLDVAAARSLAFYDLGSGAGKPVVAAATIFPFGKCVGLELLDGLVEASRDAKKRYDDVAKPRLRDAAPWAAQDFNEHAALPPADVSFERADITAADWSDGDVVFANSTCFDDGLMAAIGRKAAALKPGTVVVTLTKKLPSPVFEVCESNLYQMSWGGATVFIQRRI